MALQCTCGKKLRSDNKSGLCGKCWDKSPSLRAARNQKHLESDRASNRRSYAANPEPTRRRARKWREANPDKVRISDRDWYRNNPEMARESHRRWCAANPDKLHASDAARRALQQELFVERVYKSVVWKRDEGICHLCLEPADPADWALTQPTGRWTT